MVLPLGFEATFRPGSLWPMATPRGMGRESLLSEAAVNCQDGSQNPRDRGPLKVWGGGLLQEPGVRTNSGLESAEDRLGPNKFWPARQACQVGPVGGPGIPAYFSKSWKVLYNPATPGDRSTSPTRAYNEL